MGRGGREALGGIPDGGVGPKVPSPDSAVPGSSSVALGSLVRWVGLRLMDKIRMRYLR